MPDEQNTETQVPPVTQEQALPTPEVQAHQSVERNDDGATVSDADWDIFNKSNPTPQVNADGSPKQGQPAPVVEKREEPAPKVQVDVEVAKKDPPKTEEKKPTVNEGDELPDLEKLDDNIPKNHRDLVKQRNKMGKELRLSREREKAMEDKIKGLEEKAAKASPENEAEFQKRIDALTGDLERERAGAADVRDRLYARDVQARPEYQEHFAQPWNEVETTLRSLLAKYHQSYKDFEEAYQLKDEAAKEAALDEMTSSMSQRDLARFTSAMERIPGLVRIQKALQVSSKERLEQYRQADQQRQEQARANYLTAAGQAGKKHFDSLKAQMPELFAPTGDDPYVQERILALKEAARMSEQIAQRGVDTIPPELQGRMIYDAVTAETLRNEVSNLLKKRDQTIGDLNTRVKELEAANASLQETVDSYADGTSMVGRGGGRSVVTPNGNDASISDLVAQYWK